MKKQMLALALTACSALASAAPVVVADVSANGVNNDPTLIADGVVPAEGSAWNAASNVWWRGLGKVLTLTFDQVYELRDVLLTVDNNDNYGVEISLDKVSWVELFTIPASVGEIGLGMDTMSSALGHVEYVAAIDLAPALARYARIRALDGDNSYAVGELSFYGVAAPSAPVAEVTLPEPGSVALLGVGLALVGLAGRRRGSYESARQKD